MTWSTIRASALSLVTMLAWTLAAPRSTAQPPPPPLPTREQMSAVVPTVAANESCNASSYIRPWQGDPADPTPVSGQKEWHTDSDQQPYRSACFGSLLYPFKLGSAYGLPGTLGEGQIPIHGTNATAPGYETIPDVPIGFGSHISLLQSVMPGDFLPPSPTLGGSSECLLPPGMGDASTVWHQMGRPTLERSVDLVTGLPLVQVTDLELPFDGATFRLNRTRSDRAQHARTAIAGKYKWEPYGTDDWWDWAGQGWMMSENPLLLIDSMLPDAVGNNPATCWLILDAHHSVPFQLVESNGKYEAPPRFRATLTPTNGHRTAVNGHYYWEPAPTEYKVSLYDGALTYKFVVIREDVPPKGWYSKYLIDGSHDLWTNQDENGRQLTYHDRPLWPNTFSDPFDPRHAHDPYDPNINPGLGIPHYAVCTSIEDKSGHLVEIEYAKSTRTSLGPLPDPNGGTACLECQQDCLARGQIRSIKLKTKTNNQYQTRWTLLYVHRMFAGVRFVSTFNSYPPESPFFLDRDPPYAWLRTVAPGPDNQPSTDPRYTLHGYSAVDRIYAYEGDVDMAPLSGNSLTIPFNQTAGFDTAWDPLTAWGVGGPFANWKHQVHHEYNTYQDWPLDPYGQQVIPPHVWRWGWAMDRPASPPLLVMTSVTTRNAANPGAGSQTKRTVYSYTASAGDAAGIANPYDQLPLYPDGTSQPNSTIIPWLNAVFSPDDVSRCCTDAIHIHNNQQTASLRTLVTHRYDDGTFIPSDTSNLESDLERLLAYASVRLEHSGSDGQWLYIPNAGSQDPTYQEGTCFCPTYESLLAAPNHYIRSVPEELLRYDSQYTSVRDVTVRTSRGTSNYRIQRFLVQPHAPSAAWTPNKYNASHTPICGGVGIEPMASIFVNPYSWQGYTPYFDSGDGADPQLIDPPTAQLTSPRFIAVIDEFPDRATMVNPSEIYNGPAGIKAGQVSRRVVGINAWGLVLTDRKWEYTPTGVVRSGSGVGDEYIYNTVAQVFPDLNPCDGTEPEGCPEDRPSKAFGRELLLVEHRSVGWSVADNLNPSQGSSQGMVTFYDYDLNRSNTLSFTDYPWPCRLHEVAEGIRRGTDGTKLYRKQNFYASDSPSNMTCSVTYTEPRTSSAIFTQPPQFGFGVAPPDGVVAAHYYIERGGSSSDPMYARPVISIGQIGPAAQQRPGGSWYYPITRTVNDDQGNKIWGMQGLVLDPSDPSAHVDALCQLTLEYSLPGPYGPLATVTDAQPGTAYPNPDTGSVSVPALPAYCAGWGPLPAAGPRLGYVTAYRYDDGNGPTDIWYPGGRRYARRWVVHQPSEDSSLNWIEEFEFNDLHVVNGSFTTVVPGVRKEYEGSDRRVPPRLIERGYYKYAIPSLDLRGQTPTTEADTPSHPSGHPNDPTWQKIEAVRFARDANGRAATATKLEFVPVNGQMVWLEVGSKQINDLGEVYREFEVGANVTRTTRNDLGQTLRTYVGTADLRWGIHGTLPGTDAHDMVLIQRVEYGQGINDCWMPTTMWSYRSQPSWADAAYYDDPTSDSDGYPKRVQYDWRMRPVRTDIFDKASSGGARLSTTLTYLDHADRPTLVVTFGPGAQAVLPTGVDPVSLVDADARPPARRFYESDISPRPVSIIETIYAHDGGDCEQRTYDMQWVVSSDPNSSPSYLAERHFNGFGGERCYAQRPGEPLVVTGFDALGRVVSVRSIDPGAAAPGQEYELARTDNTIDPDGNIVEVTKLERVKDTGSALVATGPAESRNAVRTRELRWFDFSNRLIATAELGSETSSYVNGSALPATRPGTPPATFVDDDSGAVDDAVMTGDPLYAHAKIRIQAHNRAGVKSFDGELVATASPHSTWRVSKYIYDKNGRLASQRDNATDPDTTQIRVTEFGYTLGRLTRMTGWRTKSVQQYSRVAYGAEIVDENFQVVSHSNTLVGGMWQPVPDSGKEDENPANYEIKLRYDFQGRVAERLDARGAVFRYSYDAQGRLANVLVGSYDNTGFHAKYPVSMSGPLGDPVDRIGLVEYAYDAASRLQTVTARTAIGSGVVTQNKFEYDPRGNLVTDYQSYGAAVVPSTSPSTAYSWNYLATGAPGTAESGHMRLASMTYPVQGGAPARVITMTYGSSGVLDDRLSRVTAFTTNIGTPTLAQFSYAGSDRRVSLAMGGGKVIQDWRTSAEPGLAGLDTFGRAADLHVWNSAGGTLFRDQYTYDRAGSRRTALLTQAPVAGAPRDNVRSQVNAYDGLGRLNRSEVGQLSYDVNLQPVIDLNTRVRADQWSLDLLGNWSGQPEQFVPGRLISGDVNLSVTYKVNERNQVESVEATAGARKEVAYDASGSLVFDGTYYYQYDAWNRVLQINKATVQGGEGPVLNRLTIGAMVKHYAYDGLGRLIAAQSPYPWPGSGTDLVRTERYYYDGIRRIQEVVIDPVASIKFADEVGDPILSDIAEQTLDPSTHPDGDAAPLAFETGQVATVDPMPVAPQAQLAREYVWGPGDGLAGVDELLVQYGPVNAMNGAPGGRIPYFVIQDAGGDLAALCDLGGSNGDGRVVAQYIYDQYGEPMTAEILYPCALPHCGHKGLFADRLDAGVLSSAGQETARIAPGAVIICHNRNRAYLPSMGRFAQADPNATALLLLDCIAFHGSALDCGTGNFSLARRTGNGLNLYQYLGSGPGDRFDCMGLEFSVPDMMLSMGVQGWIQGLVSGAMEKIMGGSFGHGFRNGFIAGAAGGAAGYMVSAFAASASGLLGSITNGILVGEASGGVSAGLQSYLNHGDFRQALADGAWGVLTGGLIGGIGGGITFKGVDNVRRGTVAATTGWKPNPAEIKLVRDWFGSTLKEALEAGPPPAGFTRELAERYVQNLEESWARIVAGGGKPTQVSIVRVQKMKEWFGL